jgi:hypothetical protein
VHAKALSHIDHTGRLKLTGASAILHRRVVCRFREMHVPEMGRFVGEYQLGRRALSSMLRKRSEKLVATIPIEKKVIAIPQQSEAWLAASVDRRI